MRLIYTLAAAAIMIAASLIPIPQAFAAVSLQPYERHEIAALPPSFPDHQMVIRCDAHSPAPSLTQVDYIVDGEMRVVLGVPMKMSYISFHRRC